MRVSSQPAAGLGDRLKAPKQREFNEPSSLTQTKKKSKDYKSHLIGKLKMHGKLSKFLESAEEISFFHNPKDVSYLISLVEGEDYENLSACLIHALLVLIERLKHNPLNTSKRETGHAATDNTKRTLISFLNEQDSPGSSLERRQPLQASLGGVSQTSSRQAGLEGSRRQEDPRAKLSTSQLNSRGMLIQDQSTTSDKYGSQPESNPYQLMGGNSSARRPSPAGLPLGKPSDSSARRHEDRSKPSETVKEASRQGPGTQPTFRSTKPATQHTQRQTEGDLYIYSDDEQPEPKTEKKWAGVNLQWKTNPQPPAAAGRSPNQRPADLVTLGQLKTETSDEQDQRPHQHDDGDQEHEHDQHGHEHHETDGEHEHHRHEDDQHSSDERREFTDDDYRAGLEEEEAEGQSAGSEEDDTHGYGVAQESLTKDGNKRGKPNLMLQAPSEEDYYRGESNLSSGIQGPNQKRIALEHHVSPHSSDAPGRRRPSETVSEAPQTEGIAGDSSPAFGSYRNVHKGGDYGLAPTAEHLEGRLSPVGNRKPNQKLGGSPQLSFGGDQHRRDPKGTNNTTPSSEASGIRKDSAFYPGAKRFSKDSGSVDSSKQKGQKTDKDTFTFNDISSGPEVGKKARNVSLDQKTLTTVIGLKKLESPSSDDNSKHKSKHASQASDDIQTNEIQGVFQIEGEEGSVTHKLGVPNPRSGSNSQKRQSTSISKIPKPAERVNSAGSLRKLAKETFNSGQSKDLVSGRVKKPAALVAPLQTLPPQFVSPSNRDAPFTKPSISLSPETKPKVKISLLNKSGSADKPIGNTVARLSTNNTENSEPIRFSKDFNKKGLTSSFEASSGFKRSELLSQTKKAEEPSLGSQSGSRLPNLSTSNAQKISSIPRVTPLSTDRERAPPVITKPTQNPSFGVNSRKSESPSQPAKPSVKISGSTTAAAQKTAPQMKTQPSDPDFSSQMNSNSVSNLLKDAKLSTKAPSSTDILRDIKKSANSSVKPTQATKKPANPAGPTSEAVKKTETPVQQPTVPSKQSTKQQGLNQSSLSQVQKVDVSHTERPTASKDLKKDAQKTKQSKNIDVPAKSVQESSTAAPVTTSKQSPEHSRQVGEKGTHPKPGVVLPEFREPIGSNFFTGLNSPTDNNLSKSKVGELGINDMSKIPNSKNESFEKDEDLSGLHRILKENWADSQHMPKAQDGSLDFNNSRDFKPKASRTSRDKVGATNKGLATSKLPFAQSSIRQAKTAASQPAEPRITFTGTPGQNSQDQLGQQRPNPATTGSRTERDKASQNPQPKRISDIFNKASTKVSKPSKRTGISTSLSAAKQSVRNLSQQSQASSQFQSRLADASPQGLGKISEKNRSTSQSVKPLSDPRSKGDQLSSKLEVIKSTSKIGSKRPSLQAPERNRTLFSQAVPKQRNPSSAGVSPRPGSVTSSTAPRKLSGSILGKKPASVPKQAALLTPRSATQTSARKPTLPVKKLSVPSSVVSRKPLPKLESKPRMDLVNKSVGSALKGLRSDASKPLASQRKESLVSKSSRYTSASRQEPKPIFSASKLLVPKLSSASKGLLPPRKSLATSSNLKPRVSSVPLLPKMTTSEVKPSPRTLLGQNSKPVPPLSKPKSSIREALSSRQSSNSVSRYSIPKLGQAKAATKKDSLTFARKQGLAGVDLNSTQKLPTSAKLTPRALVGSTGKADNLSSLSAGTNPSYKSPQLGRPAPSKPAIASNSKLPKTTLFPSSSQRPSSLPRPKSSLLFGRPAAPAHLDNITEDIVSSSSRAATDKLAAQKLEPTSNKLLFPTSKTSTSSSKGVKAISASRLLKDLRKSASPTQAPPAPAPPANKYPKVEVAAALQTGKNANKLQVEIKPVPEVGRIGKPKKGSLDLSKGGLRPTPSKPTGRVVLNESRSASKSETESKNQKIGAQSDRIVIDTVQGLLFKNSKTNNAKGFDRIQPSTSGLKSLRKTVLQSSLSDLRTNTGYQSSPDLKEIKSGSKLAAKEVGRTQTQPSSMRKDFGLLTRQAGPARNNTRVNSVTRSVESTGSDLRGSSSGSKQRSTKGYEVPNRILEEVHEDDDSPKKFAVLPSASARPGKGISRPTTSSLEAKKRSRFDPTANILRSLDSGKKIGLSPILPTKGLGSSLTDAKLFESQEGPSPQVDKFEGAHQQHEEDEKTKHEAGDKLNTSYGEYSSMLHKLKAFSHLGGLQPYQQAQTSRDASVEIIKAMDSLVNKSLVPHDMSTEERLFYVPKEKHTPDRRFEQLRAGRITGMEESLSGTKTPIISNRKPDPNMSKSFGSGRKDHRFSMEDYSMMTEMCKSPDDPIEITAHFTGTIGGKTQPWTRRHFPERDQSRSSQTKFS